MLSRDGERKEGRYGKTSEQMLLLLKVAREQRQSR